MLTRDGGKPNVRDVMNYSAPQGPIGISRVGVGLGGHNCGNCGTQSAYETSGDGASGSPGLHGDNSGVNGTQGRR